MDDLDKISNNKLCEIIVANRYLGIMKDEALACMQELAKRRANGDAFLYEEHIENLMKTLPKFNTDIMKLFKLPRI